MQALARPCTPCSTPSSECAGNRDRLLVMLCGPGGPERYDTELAVRMQAHVTPDIVFLQESVPVWAVAEPVAAKPRMVAAARDIIEARTARCAGMWTRETEENVC